MNRGDPLRFEDLARYSRCRIADRLDERLIHRYALAAGADFPNLDTSTPASYFARA